MRPVQRHVSYTSGDMIDGRYTLEERLGGDGMGVDSARATG